MPMIKAAGFSETSVHLFSWLKSGKEIFPFIENVHSGSAAQPASYLNCYRVFLLGVKQPGRKADRSYPSSNDVKNEMRYNYSIPRVSIKWKWEISRYVRNVHTFFRIEATGLRNIVSQKVPLFCRFCGAKIQRTTTLKKI
jgi:hypothetical protein